MYADIIDSSNKSINHNLDLSPKSYTHDILGGCKSASVYGLGSIADVEYCINYLGRDLLIYNNNMVEKWYGFINQVELNIQSVNIVIRLDEVVNRVKIIYTEPAITGNTDSKETIYYENTSSISLYGIREKIYSLSNVNSNAAIQKAKRILDLYSKPQQVIKVNPNNTTIDVTFNAIGYVEGLHNQYYTNSTGYQNHDGDSLNQYKIGCGYTTNTIGFNADKKQIHDLNGKLSAYKQGEKISITGALNADNNKIYTIESSTNKDVKTYTAATLLFTNIDGKGIINDSAKLLGDFNSGDMIRVTGSSVAANNKYYFVESSTTDGERITLNTTVVSSAAGASVTIVKGSCITVSDELVTEMPQNTITVKNIYDRYSQIIGADTSTSWTMNKFAFSVKKVGNPTDNLVLEVRNSAYNILYQTVTLSNTLIETSFKYSEFQLNNLLSIDNSGVNYRFIIYRSGTNDIDNYYEIETVSTVYSKGIAQYYLNSTWQSFTEDYLPFILTGAMQTTDQIKLIVDQSNYLNGCVIANPSAINTLQYITDEITCYDMLHKLIQLGTSADKRLVFNINKNRILFVYIESINDNLYYIDVNGKLYNKFGDEIESDDYMVNTWFNISGINYKLDDQLIERVTWNEGSLPDIETRGIKDLWNSDFILGG